MQRVLVVTRGAGCREAVEKMPKRQVNRKGLRCHTEKPAASQVTAIQRLTIQEALMPNQCIYGTNVPRAIQKTELSIVGIMFGMM